MRDWQTRLATVLAAEEAEQERLRDLQAASADRAATAIARAVDTVTTALDGQRGAKSRAVRTVAEHLGKSEKTIYAALARAAALPGDDTTQQQEGAAA